VAVVAAQSKVPNYFSNGRRNLVRLSYFAAQKSGRNTFGLSTGE
jgi:hypothetical protein